MLDSVSWRALISTWRCEGNDHSHFVSEISLHVETVPAGGWDSSAARSFLVTFHSPRVFVSATD
ncbi:hypothetical protein TIFTF001_006353 [Ficus carica]|uniref:Uncharacterized protein n=1 Tax=Ficus carica TaxID=3494 RepID=A0AA88A3X4_FICCA|nr:hypothetical protein TIFTF001_006353 [Ficus carica]